MVRRANSDVPEILNFKKSLTFDRIRQESDELQ